jgi:predicted DNA-binding transcriptional regulator AlpA
MRKNEQSRPYPPDFVSAETLAYLLDCSVRSVQDYSSSGLIPKPVKIGNLVRWDWSYVRDRIKTLNNADGNSLGGEAEQDEYSLAVKKIIQNARKEANDAAN